PAAATTTQPPPTAPTATRTRVPATTTPRPPTAPTAARLRPAATTRPSPQRPGASPAQPARAPVGPGSGGLPGLTQFLHFRERERLSETGAASGDVAWSQMYLTNVDENETALTRQSEP